MDNEIGLCQNCGWRLDIRFGIDNRITERGYRITSCSIYCPNCLQIYQEIKRGQYESVWSTIQLAISNHSE
jgi:hypothetical protein